MIFNKLDLQLFNEVEGEGATEGNEDTGKQYVEKVALDDQGQVRLFRDEAAPDETADGTPPDGEQFYSPDDVRATDFEKLDPNKIPPELLPWYKSMQTGFVRKTQELSEQKRMVQEILEQAQGTPREEAPNPQMQFKSSVEQLTNAAKAQIQNAFGEEYDEFNPMHQAALTLTVQQMYGEMAQVAQRQNSLVNLEAELREQEPMYDEIYNYTKQKIGDLPYKEYVKMQRAFQTADVQTIKGFYESQRKAYYADKQGIKFAPQTPPRVQSPGGGGAPEPKGAPDYSELGKLDSFDKKMAWLREHGIKP